MTTKYEQWRNQTLVNRVNSNEEIAREYYTLATFLFKKYDERMECIQTPLLHIVSHCMELSIKSILEFACQYKYIELDFNDIVPSHFLNDLINYVLDVMDKISRESSCSPEDKDLFNNIFPTALNQLGDILQAEVASYRYAYKINGRGQVVKKSTPFVEDNDSPNIMILSKVFEDCYSALSYTSYVLEFIFPE